MKKTKIIAISANKGGVGKTSTAFNLAGALSRKMKKRVCAVDLSPQQNLSQSFGFFSDGNLTISELIYSKLANLPLVNESNVNTIIRQTEYGIDFVPANANLLKALPSMVGKDSKDIIKSIFDYDCFKDYDYIIIDCHNGNEGFLIPEIINASDWVIVVTDSSASGFLAITSITEIIPETVKYGILANKISLHLENGKEINEALDEAYINTRFRSVIPFKEQQIANSITENKPCVSTEKRNSLAKFYNKLAEEVIERTGK